ncbi:hypothetical protein GLOIN_2v1785169 [Rhizophagus irregularis DAOM 181602=DAOM 197198]|nr:hypothetical protein GLOIN_2v1785169 [Rhizophagus irregularis DAOM 181602=DAOM 197198]
MKIGEEEIWVTGRLGLTTANLSQAFAKEHSLCIKPNVLDQLFRDCHTQTPQDAFYAVAGLGGRLLNITAISMIKQCWVKFAICSKAVFVESMSDNDYVRLDAMLQNLSINLLKVFSEEFSNLSNLYVLRHLSEHA